MSRNLLVAAWLLASVFSLLGGDVLAADRWVFCGTAPWQSAIREAAHRSGIPFAWIEAVIQAESAGCAVTNGKLTTSRAGAMGLMQLMPATWAEYRSRLRLGDDPFDARDNIVAGAAYLRDLYDRYGAEGFLAADQAGPKRYEESIRDGRPLPRETLNYIARVQRAIDRIDSRSPRLASSAVPGASSLFVTLTASHPVRGHPLEHAVDTRLFVPLSRHRRFAESPHP
ncbi:MAG: lytic transglycosylase domain-containing protein [Steroidobacteraceae bacterium]